MGICMLLTLSKEGDECRDILFELCQVHGNVVLVELSIVVVLLVARNGERESAVVEFGDHRPAVITDVSHLLLDASDLRLFIVALALAIVDLILEIRFGVFLLLRGHVVELGVPLELLVDVLVLLLDHINFAVEDIYVVEKRDVLLLSLDERGNDFIDGGNTSGLLDLLEGILDDLDITDVHIHKVLLLLIVVDDLVESDFQ